MFYFCLVMIAFNQTKFKKNIKQITRNGRTFACISRWTDEWTYRWTTH